MAQALRPALDITYDGCKELILQDVSGWDGCGCPTLSYTRRDVTCRNAVLIASDGTVYAPGALPQISCISLKGNPAPQEGDQFTVFLNGCAFPYTVKAEDVASPTETFSSISFQVQLTGTPSAPCTSTFSITGLPFPISFSYSWNANPATLTAAILAGIIAAFPAGSGSNITATVSNSPVPNVITISISPNWYKTNYSNDINGVPVTVSFGACPAKAEPDGLIFTGGVPSTIDADTQTVINVLKKIYAVLTSEEAVGTDACGKEIFPCTGAQNISLNLCPDQTPPDCPIKIESKYPGEPFLISVSQNSSTATFATFTTQEAVCDFLPTTSVNSGVDILRVGVPGDDIYRVRFLMRQVIPVYFYRCVRFLTLQPGDQIAILISNGADTGLSFTFLVNTDNLYNGAVNFASAYNAYLESVGVDPYDAYVQAYGDTICIYIRDGYYPNVSLTTITVTSMSGLSTFELVNGNPNNFNLFTTPSDTILLEEIILAHLCELNCRLMKDIERRGLSGDCDAPALDKEILNIFTAIQSIEFKVCQGDVCGAVDDLNLINKGLPAVCCSCFNAPCNCGTPQPFIFPKETT